MGIRKQKILVLADFPLYKDKVHGGLQRRIFPLLESLTDRYEVYLFCGEGSNIQLRDAKIYQAYNSKCEMLKGFVELFKGLSEKVDILLSLETSYAFQKPDKRMLIMGGMAYEWSWKVVKGASWSCIVVPSEHAQDLLARQHIRSEVIHNGYDWKPFLRASQAKVRTRIENKKKILINPHRPDLAKGHYEAILLTRKLIDLGIDCRLRIPQQDFFMTPESFYENLARFAHKHLGSESFILDPWVNASNMPEYYASADITLALGSIQEGFGAVVVESIMSGTPVLATRRGAVPGLVPDGRGLFLIDVNDQVNKKNANLAAKIITNQQGYVEEDIRRGQHFIRAHYNKADMTKNYTDLVRRVLSLVKAHE